MAVIRALRTTISDGTVAHPMFLGYLAASELNEVAEVPSFSTSSSNDDIARNILNPPVKDWQRPVIDSKWKAIRDKFSKQGELMPNPVLLAVGDSSLVSVLRQQIHGQMTEVYEIEVKTAPTGARKALWILDGQHRVRGMSSSANSSNPIPLVLLHDDGQPTYSPQQFAKVFAEVTTSATPLNELHGEWLKYAFKLDHYELDSPPWKAMTATAMLCDLQQIDSAGVTNPFHGRVQFNPELPVSPAIAGGFGYSALALKDILLAEYFSRPNANLQSKDLAEQVSLAVSALVGSDVTTTTSSAFFGDRNHRQSYIQDGFVAGVCRYLAVNGVPGDWASVLASLNFSGSNWDFSGWVNTTGGNAGNVSKRVANQVFRTAFASGALPSGVGDLPTYLQGDQAEVVLRASSLGPNGRASRKGQTDSKYLIGSTKTLNLGAQRHIKLISMTDNIGKLEVLDRAQPFDNTYSAANLKKGIVLPSAPGQVQLTIRAEYFGSVSAELRLTLTWS